MVFAICPHLINCLLCCSMATVSELVDEGDIPEERKADVKRVLHDLAMPCWLNWIPLKVTFLS